jgi:opacity protein-like surface antigen
MKKSTVGILAALAAVSMAGTASAQMAPTSPFAIEVRGGLAFPIDLEGVETGLTFGGDVIFQATPMFGIYAGYNFATFAIDDEEFEEEELEDVEADIEVKGFRAGVRANLPLATAGASPFAFGGLVYQSFGFSVSDGETEGSFSGDEELGFEVGAGVEIPLGTRLSFTPAVSYVKIEDAKAVKADVGLKIRF